MEVIKDENEKTMPAAGSGSFGFIKPNLSHRLTPAVGSETLVKLAEEINAQYKTIQDETERPRVTIIDKTQLPNIMFSAIVSSIKRNGVVYYYTAIIEATGERHEPQTVSRVMAEVNEMNQPGRIPSQRRGIWVTADANDQVYHKQIIDILVKVYGTDLDFDDVGAVIVPSNANLSDGSFARNIAAISQQACMFGAVINENDSVDLNIVKAKQQEPNLMFSITADTNIIGNKDEVGSPIRSDLHMGLWVKSGSNATARSLNESGAEKEIIDLSGYIEPFPEKINLGYAPGTNMPISAVRFHPHFVLTEMKLYDKTLGFALVGIASSTAAINPEIWMASVIPENAKAAKFRNPGALNKIANLNGVEGVVDIMEKGLSPDERVGIVQQMFLPDPFFSMDIDLTSPQGFYLFPFAVGAMPPSTGVGSNKDDARRDIVDAANWLTNGNFPKDYSIDKIFARDAVLIPLGRWHDGTTNEERDLRDIDLTTIATLHDDMDMMARWVMSYENPTSCFLERISIINKIMPDAVVTGKAWRVTFHPEFIATLTNAVKAAGMNIQVDPLMTFSRGVDIASAANMFSNAGISTIPTFTTSYNPTNFNMSGMMYGGGMFQR